MSDSLVTGLDHLVLTVADVAATCSFYQRTLGFRRVDYGDGRVALAFGSQKLNLHAADALHPPVPARPCAGSADLCFLTEQPIAQVLRGLRAAGVPLVDGPIERAGASGAIVSVYLHDPDGNLIEIGAPADRIGTLRVRAATGTDRAAVHALLDAARLPLDGVEDAWPRMRVACDDARVVSAAGVEVHDRAALLRSVVVDPAWRGRGIGEELVWRVLAAARAEGLDDAWLLTFIPDWFSRLGFGRTERAAAPASMRQSSEFTGACPESAVAMRRPPGSPRRSARDLALVGADPRYPLGPFVHVPGQSAQQRAQQLAALAELPASLRAAVTGLHNDQLDTPVREGGWTVRQTVHHIADSHMNAFIRIRWALTEDAPHIKAYEQDLWSALSDNAHAPVEWSLELLEGLQRRMHLLLASLDAGAWNASYTHPENGRQTLDELVQHYAWHGQHHTAQILALRARNEW